VIAEVESPKKRESCDQTNCQRSDRQQEACDVEFPDTCVLVDATADDAFTMLSYRALRRALIEVCDVVLLTNRCSKQQDQNHINIPTDEIFTAVEHHKPDRTIIPGNPDLKLLAAVAHPRLSGFSSFIRVEYDVVCTGEIKSTFQALCRVAAEHDFGASQFRLRETHPSWTYWSTLGNRLDPTLEPPQPHRAAFLPVMVLSARFLSHYRDALRAGWVGHYETLMPSVASWQGLLIVDLGRHEPPFTTPATFRIVRPKDYTLERSLLLHPVKRMTDLMRAPSPVALELIRCATPEANPEFRFLAELELTPAETDLLKSCFFTCDSLLVFGSDAMAALALACGVQMVTVLDSRMEMLRRARDRYNLARYVEANRLLLQHIEIGAVDSTGAPVRDPDRSLWKRYVSPRWDRVQPDLILLNGRFRVLAALKAHAALHGQQDFRLACPSFHSRPHYHALLRAFTVQDSAGDLAILTPAPASAEEIAALMTEFEADPR
jgi:hypothetical protein